MAARRAIEVRGNDHIAIQNAIEEVGRGSVILPSGRYRIGRTITVPSNIDIVGRSPKPILELEPEANCHFFTNAGHSIGNSGITISNISFEGNSERQDRPHRHVGLLFSCAFYGVRLSQCRFADLDIKNVRQTGMHFTLSESIELARVTCSRMGWSGISTFKTDRINIQSAVVVDTGLESEHSAIHIDGGEHYIVRASVKHSSGNGIMLEARPKDLRSIAVIADCSGCKRGLALIGHNNNLSNVMVSKSSFSRNDDVGVLIANAADVLLCTSIIAENITAGVLIDGKIGASNCMIVGNRLFGNGTNIIEWGTARTPHIRGNHFKPKAQPDRRYLAQW